MLQGFLCLVLSAKVEQNPRIVLHKNLLAWISLHDAPILLNCQTQLAKGPVAGRPHMQNPRMAVHQIPKPGICLLIVAEFHRPGRQGQPQPRTEARLRFEVNLVVSRFNRRVNVLCQRRCRGPGLFKNPGIGPARSPQRSKTARA